MPISITCPCGKKLKVPDNAAGKKAKCPACGVVQEVSRWEVPEEKSVFVPITPPAARTLVVQPELLGIAGRVVRRVVFAFVGAAVITAVGSPILQTIANFKYQDRRTDAERADAVGKALDEFSLAARALSADSSQTSFDRADRAKGELARARVMFLAPYRELVDQVEQLYDGDVGLPLVTVYNRARTRGESYGPDEFLRTAIQVAIPARDTLKPTFQEFTALYGRFRSEGMTHNDVIDRFDKFNKFR
jgi:hypothetical protein